MNKNEALRIIKKEKLMHYNWFGEHNKWSNEVCIIEDNGKYIVYTTSERAAIEGKREFLDESEALEDFIKRLRADKRYTDLVKDIGV